MLGIYICCVYFYNTHWTLAVICRWLFSCLIFKPVQKTFCTKKRLLSINIHYISEITLMWIELYFLIHSSTQVPPLFLLNSVWEMFHGFCDQKNTSNIDFTSCHTSRHPLRCWSDNIGRQTYAWIDTCIEPLTTSFGVQVKSWLM